MTIQDILNSKQSLIKINSIKFSDFKIALKLSKFAKKVDSCIETFNAEQQKIISLYVKKNENGQPVISENGQLVFNSDADKASYIDSMNKILSTELDDIEPLTIKVSEIQVSGDISANDLLATSALINWEE